MGATAATLRPGTSVRASPRLIEATQSGFRIMLLPVNAEIRRSQSYLRHRCRPTSRCFCTGTHTCVRWLRRSCAIFRTRCDDDHAEYLFENGAIVHYYYAGGDPDKSIKDALLGHGNVSLSYYDAVAANHGNDPQMTVDNVCKAAFELQALSVPFFWLSTYSGQGSINTWNDMQKAQFTQSGARFVNVGHMVFGLSNLTKGVVEDLVDPHFCLPGPPDELGFLFLKIIWALYHEGVAAA
ncbi:unnamed protein product [Ectocarpus sp. 6 AP-2014]